MFIEEIIIDGFKSYATRTVVSGFDPRFNAITGLNGSGKSNVLDAICFVLGITNLSQVRANNLQELVYKQGQAGVTKASVTIIFNNKDPHGSPVGYEQYEQISVARQVAIGGRNKYLINGHTAQVSQVQNLFHSVQLNVNNPHFLIMQGHITKVLNMKPPQILGMIEEAAGTRMYENKKQAALKTMMKKEKKVEEINQVLAQEITPTLEKLRQEKTHYLQWASNNTEMERLQRFCIAFEYTKAKETIDKNQVQVQNLEKIQEEFLKEEKNLSNQMDLLEDQMETLQEQKELEMGENFHLLKQKEEEIEKEIIKYQTKQDHLNSSLQKQQTIQKQNDLKKKELLEKITQKEEILQKYTQEMDLFQKNTFDHKEKQIQQIQLQIQNLHSGMVEASSSSSQVEQEATSLAEQLALKQRLLQEEKTLLKQTKLKIKHMEKNLFTKRQTVKKNQSNGNHLIHEREQKCLELKHIQNELTKLLSKNKFSPQEEEHLKQTKNHLQDEIVQKERDLDDLTSRMSSKLTAEFEFTNPEKNFDRSKVKGLLAKLFETKKEFAALALEITAGGKLYQIVVDDEKTAKMILQYGRLMQRVTMIPLNKITRRTLDPSKKKFAQQIAHQKNSKVWEAMELIHFDPIVRPAMEYTFGNTLICENSELAKNITFHKDLKIRTVTLEGDSFDPAGTLQGGSAPNQNNTPILLQLHRFLQATKNINTLKTNLNQVMENLNAMQLDSRQYSSFIKQKEMKEYELKLLEDRIASSEFTQIEKDLKEMEKAYQNEQSQLSKHEQQIDILEKEVEHLQQEIQLISSSRQEKLKTLEENLKKSKKEFQEILKKQKQIQTKFNEIQMDLKILQKELESLVQNYEKGQEECEKLQKESQDLQNCLNEKQLLFNEIQQNLQQKRDLLRKCDTEMKDLQLKQNSVTKQKNSIEMERKKNDQKLQKYTKELQETTHTLKKMYQTNSWIENEKEFFGRDHTDYDFTRRDPMTAKKRMMELQEIQAKLSKKINKKVMGMIEKAEQEYQGLMNKREIIEKDKEKITSVIKELDTKKNEALQTTWLKVNKDFGSIFSTLLPGTTAKLEPPANSGTILDGLQVRVAFGSVWKESLTELSGGQRSLLALSLILSLLLFKPAPMYILDEVDAALDLSHTQNIGQMIRTHFGHSQFIVVSLKEGMFNNANVVFRTKFVDGVSTVTRTVPTGAASSSTSSKGRKQK